MKRKVIDSFRVRHWFLSNFSEATVHLDGVAYRTVEHAYQAAKTSDRAEREWVRESGTAGEAKRRGRKVTLRPDWDEGMKLFVMRTLLRRKFRSPTRAAKLRATGNAELVEGNDWGDRFWGVCGGEGENHLGRLLMEIREEIRENGD